MGYRDSDDGDSDDGTSGSGSSNGGGSNDGSGGSDEWKKAAIILGAAGLGAVGAVVATPILLGAVGFTAIGPAAGTAAAAWQASMGAV